MSRISDGRISALAQLVLAQLKSVAVLNAPNDRVALQEIKAALNDYLRVDEALDAKVRRKIASLSRRVVEGSSEWDILYRQYFEEEKRKISR